MEIETIPAAGTDSEPSVNNKSSFETVVVNDDEFCICRPSEPQPEGTIELPERYVGGIYYVKYQEIDKLRSQALQELCKSYDLNRTGNKATLKERLVGFSENMVRWKVLVHGARRAHRGVRAVTEGKVIKKSAVTKASSGKRMKLSTLRRNELMGLPPDTPLNAQIFGTERSKDTRTLEEKNNLIRWAHEFCESHPYIPIEEIRRMQQARKEVGRKPNSSAALTELVRTNTEQISTLTSMVSALAAGAQIQTVPAQLFSVLGNTTNTHVASSATSVPRYSSNSLDTSSVASSCNVQPRESPSPSPGSENGASNMTGTSLFAHVQTTPTFRGQPRDFSGADSSPPKDVVSTLNPLPPLLAAGNDAIMLDSTAEPASSHDRQVSRSEHEDDEMEDHEYAISIAHGQILRFKYSDIPDPSKQITFALDIARLDAVWDDEGPRWNPDDCISLLSIKGTPVALRYWPQVYSGCKLDSRKQDRRWHGLRGIWTEWKFVAERYRASTPEAFWKEFSTSSGEQLNWTAITERLRDQRGEQVDRLVEKAKTEYGDLFNTLFLTRKRKVMSKPSIIARRYLELKGEPLDLMDID